ncbi:hypothetical protein SAMN05446037_1003271 [Anaerovirgula multivorans]|uniref:Uncharacterized protein n=1 Tax=Anaerovirgula multivorans TaxID=312168 RepID=A0A239BII0_9FIRM|nr:hypothetical protein [Anaerovirgula multivorans]SNS07231.1 hypothetical protein SAMN05446037_1003271 [Anaerovirgula multivorans]
MDKIQVTLTVEEGKEIIALGILKHPLLTRGLEKGKVLFKGGTTVSRITEKLVGLPLRISGRITPRGTVAGLNNIDEPHSIIINKGSWMNVDEKNVIEAQKFTSQDVIVCGANAFDAKGRAALMAGSPGGGNVGLSMSTWCSEGTTVIIPVGIEKMIPGDLDEIIKKSSRTGKKLAWGMSVGLLPIYGEIFTEVEAIKKLADVDCFPIGAGGLSEAQGSVTLEIWGDKEELKKVIDILKIVKSKNIITSGLKDSLVECEAICHNCSRHLGCGYKAKAL